MKDAGMAGTGRKERIARLAPWAWLAAALLGAALFWAGTKRMGAELELRVELPEGPRVTSPWLQVMHASGGGFTEPSSVWTRLPPDRRSIGVRLPADQVRWLRLDFAVGHGEVRVCEARVRVRSRQIALRNAYSVAGSKQLDHAGFDDEGCLALRIEAAADDPFVVLRADDPGSLPSRAAIANVRRAVALGAVLLVLGVVGLGAWLPATAAGARVAQWARKATGALDARLHWVVLAVVLGFGAVHALVGPPNYTPDEAAHLSKVARMHAGHPFDAGEGSLLPNIAANHGALGNLLGNKGVLDPETLAAVREAPLRCEPEVRTLPGGANAYFPHVYLPTWAVYAGACATQASFGRFLDLARLLNLLLAAGLVGWGVAMAGPLRWPLATVAMLPMGVAQYASVSSDALTLSMAFAAIGGLAGAAAGDAPLRRLWPPLLVLAIGLALAKPGAPWVLAIALLAWPECRRQGIGFLGWTLTLVVLPALVHLGWTMWASGEAAQITREYAVGNRELLSRDPGRFLGMVWNTFTPPFVDALWRGAIGRLGWLDIDLPRHIYAMATLALGATLLLGGRLHAHGKGKGEVVARSGMLLVALGSLLLISVPLFLYWTDPAGAYVQGLQGRYFLPTIAVLLGFAAVPGPVVLRLVASLFVLAVVVWVNFEGVKAMFDAYYVSGRRA